MKIYKVVSGSIQLLLLPLAMYGSYRLCRDHESVSPPPQYESHFQAGIQDVGPGEAVTLSQVGQLVFLAADNPSSTWKMYVFPDAPSQEPSTFLDVVSAEGYPLVRFRFVKITVDCRRGPVPDSFKVSPEPTTIAVR